MSELFTGQRQVQHSVSRSTDTALLFLLALQILSSTLTNGCLSLSLSLAPPSPCYTFSPVSSSLPPFFLPVFLLSLSLPPRPQCLSPLRACLSCVRASGRLCSPSDPRQPISPAKRPPVTRHVHTVSRSPLLPSSQPPADTISPLCCLTKNWKPLSTSFLFFVFFFGTFKCQQVFLFLRMKGRKEGEGAIDSRPGQTTCPLLVLHYPSPPSSTLLCSVSLIVFF